MKRLEREVLLKLIIFCEKCNYSIKKLYMQEGSILEPHLAKVVDNYSKEWILEYFNCNGEWKETPTVGAIIEEIIENSEKK